MFFRSKWVTVEFPFDRPDDNEKYTLIINPGNTIHSDRNKATIWIKSIDIVPLGGAASSNTETILPVDPNTIIYDLKVGDWKPFRFTSEGSNVTSGTKPNLPNGVSLHCWKPKSVAQFVGADSGDGLTVGLTNLNDETSSQFLAQLEYDLNVKLVTGKRYAVRVDYRTVNEGAGNVTLQSEEYSIVQTTPLEATAGAWQTKDALFTRQEGKPIRIAINSTGIGEGNTLGIRRVTVFEVP